MDGPEQHVRVVLEVAWNGGRVAGVVRTGRVRRPFSGWLDLIAALEAVLSASERQEVAR